MKGTHARAAGEAKKRQQQGAALNCLDDVRPEDVSEHD